MSLKSALSLVLLSLSVATVYANNSDEQIVPIYITNEPWPQMGFDVSTEQVPAIRFEPEESVSLDYIEMWFMNNSSDHQGEVTISLTTDVAREDGQSEPSEIVLESWTFQISSRGWLVQKEVIESELKPYLEAGQRYWIVAQSDSAPIENPVWNVAGPMGDNIVLGYYGRLDPAEGTWSVGRSSIPAIRIYGQD